MWKRDATPFSTLLAINHPLTTLIQQLITKISSYKGNQQYQQDQQIISSHSSYFSKRLFLQKLPVTLKHSNKTVRVDALLNSESDTTIISVNFSWYLCLQFEEEQVEIKSALSETVNLNEKTVSSEIIIDNGKSNLNINVYKHPIQTNLT